MSIKRDAFLNLSLSEKGGPPQVNSRKTIPESCDSLSGGGSEFLATRKLSVVGRSNAVQSPIVPSIALSATTSLDQPNNEEPSALQGTFEHLEHAFQEKKSQSQNLNYPAFFSAVAVEQWQPGGQNGRF